MKQKDEFVTTMGKVSDFIRKYSREFALGIAVVAVVLISFVVFKSLSGVYSEKSGKALSSVIKLAEKDEKAAIEEMRKVSKKYPFTNAGALASFYEAELLYKTGSQPEAVEKFRDVAEDGKNSLVGSMASLKLARLAVQDGNFSDAEKYLAEISSAKKNPMPKDYVLFLLAETREKNNDAEGAEAAYSELVEKYPESGFRAKAENKIIELGGSKPAENPDGI